MFTLTLWCAYDDRVARINHQFGWQAWAECRKKNAPSYLFFTDEQRRPDFKPDPKFAGKTAKDFCGPCEVKASCNEFALLHDLQGTWGGKSEVERDSKSSEEDREELRDYKRSNGEFWSLYGHS